MSRSLVIQAARFGDLVQSRRLIQKLASREKVHLLVDVALAPLARLIYPFATVHELHFHCRPGELNEGTDLLRSSKNVLAELRQTAFCRIYNLNFSPATAAVCRLFEPDKVIGHRPGPGGNVLRSAWVRMVFRLGSRRRINPLNLVDYWGYFAEDSSSSLDSPDKVRLDIGTKDKFSCKFCEAPILSCGDMSRGQVVGKGIYSDHDHVSPPAKSGGRGLGIVMAGRVARRSLPVPLLASIVQTAGSILGSRQIYLFGTAEEQQIAARLLRQLHPNLAKRVVNLCGKTDWVALIEHLTGLDALISPDTGTMHLAAMLGVPVIGFFLSNAWCHETGPYGNGHKIFQALPDCAPCLESAPCTCGTVCLNTLQAPDLLRGVARALAGDRNFPMPPGVACLESSFDGFGLRYTRIAGQEASLDQEMREAVRLLASRFVTSGMGRYGHDPAKLTDDFAKTVKLTQDEFARLADWLFPDSEWMLPAWRYC